MVQLVTKIDDATANALDELVSAGEYASRSAAVRAGIERIIDESRRSKTASLIVAGYQRLPETADELELARIATIAMIAEEPW